VNFLRRLALREKKLDDSSHLAFVEITRVPDRDSKLVSFLVRLRTYQHPRTTYFCELAENALETFTLLSLASGEQIMGKAQVSEWLLKFKCCLTSVQDAKTLDSHQQVKQMQCGTSE